MKVTVYYADTDAGGVVYYANYLRWLEMARVELINSFGSSVAAYAESGFTFAVAHVDIDYRASAVLGDEVEVESAVEEVRRVRFTLRHRLVRAADHTHLTDARVTCACVDASGKVCALPAELAQALRELERRQ